ncbi:nuclear transport factor 2 family protein [Geodermatophilus sabuli]|uniref:Nuclear transport factor 2 family protein n=1 Tax=Geodermatophilus sabuli TaxID=1564158 RepID=A0A7K3VZJ6_9ACTN|nr:nuclear transport factor 2 family protein [Geodermatophilus sabuli]NEK57057.1 nuclear transport factor 2 family protein [Geodermatophilus sabuli]
MTQTTDTSVETVTALYDAFARGDVATVIGALDENVEWYEAEGNPWHPGRAFVGPQQVVEGVLARIAEDFEDFRVEPHKFISNGETVAVEARYRATSHRATGKPLDAQVAHVWDVRDGKVVRFQQYVDTRQLADVMGVAVI